MFGAWELALAFERRWPIFRVVGAYGIRRVIILDLQAFNGRQSVQLQRKPVRSRHGKESL